MADWVTPDGVRQTLARTVGHQIRVVVVRNQIRITCRCLIGVAGAVRWSVRDRADGPDTWAAYNGLPHRVEAGPFTPVGVIEGVGS